MREPTQNACGFRLNQPKKGPLNKRHTAPVGGLSNSWGFIHSWCKIVFSPIHSMKWLSFLVRTLKADLDQKSWLRPPNEPRNREPCFGSTMLRGSPNQNPEKTYKKKENKKGQKSDWDFAKQKTKRKQSAASCSTHKGKIVGQYRCLEFQTRCCWYITFQTSGGGTVCVTNPMTPLSKAENHVTVGAKTGPCVLEIYPN